MEEKGSPYLPTSVFEPFGVSIIQRLLDAAYGGGRSCSTEKSQRRPPNRPATCRLRTCCEAGINRRLIDGWWVGFLDQNEVEHSVGMFLAQHESPSRKDIAQFTNNLPDNMSEAIDDFGWDNLALSVDKAVLEAIRDPQDAGRDHALLESQSGDCHGVRQSHPCSGVPPEG